MRAKRDRALYVVDVLTVLRAYIVAGRPKPSGAHAALGSFEEWSDLVRDALIWLGEPDPCLTMERIRKQDPKRNALAAVLHQWRDVMVDSEDTAKGVVDVATEKYGGGGVLAETVFRYPDFRDALMAVAGDKGAFINTTKLGHWLSRHKDRVLDGLRIEQGISNAQGGIVRWKVVKV
jgi:putative DNA primase/helicase